MFLRNASVTIFLNDEGVIRREDRLYGLREQGASKLSWDKGFDLLLTIRMFKRYFSRFPMFKDNLSQFTSKNIMIMENCIENRSK